MTESLEVSRYLDSDKRPSAVVITPSSAEFWIFEESATESAVQEARPKQQISKLSFVGVLGAIESSVAGRFVGFSGVEVKASAIQFARPSDLSNEFQIAFDIAVQSPGANTLTVEFVVDESEESHTYTRNFPVMQGANQFRAVPLVGFERTIRGVTTGEFFNLQNAPWAYRFFFKRSVNQAQSIEAIPISFILEVAN